MGKIDVAALLAEVSADAPCGDNLEYDPAYGELERSTVGKPEQQFGETIIPAEEPDWAAVKRQSLSLAERTKDMRVGVVLARALIQTDGFVGFADALALLRGYVDKYWATVHPQLDPDDWNDPTLRVNTLVSLCDGETTLRMLKRAPLVRSRAMGPVSLLDWAVAHGELPAPAGVETPPTASSVDAAFQDVAVDELQGIHEAVRASIADVQHIEAEVTSLVGASQAASLSPLVSVLKDAEKILAAQLSRRGVSQGVADTPGTQGEAAPGPTAAAPVVVADGEIRTRDDVIRALDRICQYYERNEPSSPVPMLLRRSKRLATMSFLEILRELTPGGLAQAEALGGISTAAAAEESAAGSTSQSSSSW